MAAKQPVKKKRKKKANQWKEPTPQRQIS